MALPRRHVGLLLLSAGACLLARPLIHRSLAQDQAPNRHEVSLVARDFRWTPRPYRRSSQDDLVRLTIRSEDIAYSFAIDEYRIVRRVPAGGVTTFEFRADRPGHLPLLQQPDQRRRPRGDAGPARRPPR